VVAGPQTEEAFLMLIAARPGDAAIRRVFADWLLEQNEPRGEVMVLSQQRELSSADRRRIDRLTKANAHKWLGPLAPVVLGAHEDDEVDGLQCRFEGGLLAEVRFRALVAKEWRLLTGEPRLATVSSMSFAIGALHRPPAEFLAHPVMANVRRLECDAALLNVAAEVPFRLEWLRVHTTNHASDLDELVRFSGLASVSELVLSIHMRVKKAPNERALVLLGAQTAGPMVDELLESGAVRGRDHFELDTVSATPEGVAEALLSAAVQLRRTRQRVLQRFTVRYRDTPFSLTGDRFQFLEIDPSSRDGEWTIDSRIASAAAVMSQLAGAACQVEMPSPTLLPVCRATKT